MKIVLRRSPGGLKNLRRTHRYGESFFQPKDKSEAILVGLMYHFRM